MFDLTNDSLGAMALDVEQESGDMRSRTPRPVSGGFCIAGPRRLVRCTMTAD
jgi:hypothetical protein